MKHKKILTNNSGFGIIEVLVSAVITMFVITASVTTIQAGRNSQKQLESIGACESLIRSAKQRLASLGTDTYMQKEPLDSFFLYSSNGFNGSFAHTRSDIEEQSGVSRQDRWPEDSGQSLYTVPSTYGGNITFRKNRLYANGINTLAAIYNSNRSDYCLDSETATSGFGTYTGTAADGSSLFPSGNTSGLQNVETKIRIEPYLLATGQPSSLSAERCREDFYPMPKRLNQSFNNTQDLNVRTGRDVDPASTNLHFSNFGLRLKLLVNYENTATENIETCRGSMDFSYPASVIRPSVPQNNVDSNFIETSGFAISDIIEVAEINTSTTGSFLPSDFVSDGTMRRSATTQNICTEITGGNNRDMNLTFTIQKTFIGNGHSLLCRSASRSIDSSSPLFNQNVTCRNTNASGVGSVHSGNMISDTDKDPTNNNNTSSKNTPGVIRPSRYFSDTTSTADTGADAGWVPCEKLVLCGTQATTANLSETLVEATLSVRFDNLPEACLARAEYAVIDTAGNFSDIGRVDYIAAHDTCGELCHADDYLATAGQSDFYQCGGCPSCNNFCDMSSTCYNPAHSSCVATCTDAVPDANARACTDGGDLTSNQTYASQPEGCKGAINNICDWECNSGFYWESSTSSCEPIGTCIGSIPDTNGVACSHSGVIAAKSYRSAEGCTTGDVCDWACAPGFGFVGGSCQAFSCNASGLPAGAIACSVSGLTSNKNYRTSPQGCTSSANVCDWQCDTANGFTWNATTSTCEGPACTGTTPANSVICTDGPGVTVSTAKSLRSACSPSIRCDYTCEAGYHLSGGSCVPNACSGSAPADATACANTPFPATHNNVSFAYAASNTCSGSVACGFTCNSGFTWDGVGCVSTAGGPGGPGSPTIACTDNIIYQFDGWVGNGPMCERFNRHQEFCGGFDNCTISNQVFLTNTEAICDMRYTRCDSGRPSSGSSGGSSGGGNSTPACIYNNCTICEADPNGPDGIQTCSSNQSGCQGQQQAPCALGTGPGGGGGVFN